MKRQKSENSFLYFLVPVTSDPPLSVGGFHDNLQLSANTSLTDKGPSGSPGLSGR
jgi:hypothetical protein